VLEPEPQPPPQRLPPVLQANGQLKRILCMKNQTSKSNQGTKKQDPKRRDTKDGASKMQNKKQSGRSGQGSQKNQSR
jgi:hypothetical protein